MIKTVTTSVSSLLLIITKKTFFPTIATEVHQGLSVNDIIHLTTLVQEPRTYLPHMPSSYNQFCVYIAKFLLPWQRGSVGAFE